MAQTEVLMPSMGEGVAEANLVAWLKKAGEAVRAGEPLLQVSTDKVDTEIPAPANGFVISLHGKEGDVIRVNDVIAIIADTKDDAGQASSKAAPTAAATANNHNAGTTKVASSSAAAMSAPGREGSGTMLVDRSAPLRSSPLVRKIAQEHAVPLDQVAGSGMHGRITKRDILDFIEKGGNNTTSSLSTAPQQPPIASITAPGHTAIAHSPAAPALRTSVQGDMEYLDGVPVERVRMSRMRQLIADHMVESVRTSPHVTTTFEVDMHRVWQLREKSQKAFLEREGFKLTFTPFLIHAAVEAIKKHPIVNCSVDGYDVLYKKDINIGCAVALDNGLIVPVIKKAGELNLVGIARRLNDLITRARHKKLLPEDVQGGTFSITNPGGFGSVHSNPIINQPQVAILCFGAIIKRPVVIDDMIAVRPQSLISLTFDHRVIDGEGGAKYLATLKGILENYTQSPL